MKLCTRESPCEGRTANDGELWTEDTRNGLAPSAYLDVQGSGWGLYGEHGAFITFVTHCPWCGGNLGPLPERFKAAPENPVWARMVAALFPEELETVRALAVKRGTSETQALRYILRNDMVLA